MTRRSRDGALVAGEIVLPVLGVPVRYRSASAVLVEAVERAFGAWRDVPGAWPTAAAGEEAPAIELIADEAAGTPGVGAAGEDAHMLRFNVTRDDVLLVTADGVEARADAVAGRAQARLGVGVSGKREVVEACVLEALTLFLVTARDRLPVHAAAVLVKGRALLLAAPGGTGKSTLAYACLRAGWTVLSDDAVYIQSRPRTTVWAMGRGISLAPGAADLVPGLEAHRAVRRADGRGKVVVPLEGTGPRHARPGGVCLLTRGGGRFGRVEPMAADAAVAALLEEVEPGFDRFADTMRTPLEAVARRGAWRVHMAEDPLRTVALLASLP